MPPAGAERSGRGTYISPLTGLSPARGWPLTREPETSALINGGPVAETLSTALAAMRVSAWSLVAPALPFGDRSEEHQGVGGGVAQLSMQSVNVGRPRRVCLVLVAERVSDGLGEVLAR